MSSARAAMRLTMGMVGLLPLELSGAWNSISGRAVLRVAEYALEDRVDVLEMVAEVELLVDLGVRQVFLYVRVLLQQRIEIAFAAPDRHRVALHQPVGVLAAGALLRQCDQDPLRVDEPAEPVEVLLHVGRIDQEL